MFQLGIPLENEFVNAQSFLNARVLVVGDAMLDRYWFGDASRISPEAPVPIVKINHSEERLGGRQTLPSISPVLVLVRHYSVLWEKTRLDAL